MSRASQERKIATALFVDIVGYTSLVEQHDPEIVDALVRRASEVLCSEIERHGGLVERTIGDAIFAVFGLPTIHEDDPERAVRAGLQLHAALATLNRQFEAEGRPQLEIRVGIETGQMLVDLSEVEGARDRMVVGDPVNVASRLQAGAKPGTVFVGPNAFAATKDIFDYEQVGAFALKGRADATPAWLAIRPRSRVRGERPPRALEAPIIGRDDEIAILKRALERAKDERRPILTTILGSPGVGKSRLVRELAKFVDDLPDRCYWRSGRCLSYGDVTYSALVDAVKAQCEIVEDDPPELVERKIERTVRELFEDDSLVPSIRVLVGGESNTSLSREELFDSWRRFFERMAAQYPVVLSFEDIHWADEGLLDFIDHIAEWGRGPLMIVTAARPELLERRRTWGGGKRSYFAIYLDPLSKAESRRLLDELTSGALPEAVQQTVLERSDGNPLFTEEIVRKFVDEGSLRSRSGGGWQYLGTEDRPDIPGSIQSLIGARLDGLGREEKSLVQQAAVVGRIFWTGLVATLTQGEHADAQETIRGLQLKEVVVPRDVSSFSEQAEFAFHHVLIRDVAYESLPKSKRAASHRSVARWIEEQAGERKDELAETIATHYVAAVDYARELGSPVGDDIVDQAFRWSRTAGERSVRVWDLAEAVRWYRRALDLADSAGASEREIAELWERYADVSSRRLDPDDVAHAYEEAIVVFERIGDQEAAARVETALVNHLVAAGRYGSDELGARIDNAIRRLESDGHTGGLADSLFVKGRYLWMRGAYDQAEPILQRALDLARKSSSSRVIAQTATTLGSLVQQLGRTDEGLVLLEEAVSIARKLGDLPVFLRCINNLAGAMWEVDRTGRQEEILDEAIEVARRSGDLGAESWMRSMKAALAALRGDLMEGEKHARRALECARLVNAPMHLTEAFMHLVELLVLTDRLDEAEAVLAESATTAATEYTPFNVWFLFSKGLLMRARNELDEAAETFLASIAARERADYQAEADEWLHFEGIRALVLTGRTDEARALNLFLQERAALRPMAKKLALWAEAALEEDPTRAVSLLKEVVARFVSIDWPLSQGIALIDLARAERRAGKDPTATLEEALAIFKSTGATLYEREVGTELELVAKTPPLEAGAP